MITIPPGVEVYLICEPRGWRGELRDGNTVVEARGADPHTVLAGLLALYQESGKDPVLA